MSMSREAWTYLLARNRLILFSLQQISSWLAVMKQHCLPMHEQLEHARTALETDSWPRALAVTLLLSAFVAEHRIE